MTELQSFSDVASEWKTLANLIDPNNGEWIERIRPALFTGKRKSVFEAIQNSYSLYGSVSWDGLRNCLNGDVPNELAAGQGGNIKASIDRLVKLALKRYAAQRAATFKELSEQEDPSLDQLQEAALIEPILADEDSTLVSAAQGFLNEVERKRSGEYPLMKSGFKFLDNSFGGEYKRKKLVIYAGSPGAGKTTLIAQSMRLMAEGYTNEITGELVITPSLCFSLEMSREDFITKWVGAELEIDTQDIIAGRIDDDQMKAIEEKTVYFQKLPIYIIDTEDITLNRIRYEIRKHKNRYGVRVVFFDYLQIANHSPTGNKNKDLGDFAKQMKAIAKSEDIAIIILSQITPGNDDVFRIRDSGDVPSHADAIFEGELVKDDLTPLKTVNVMRSKNRLGPTGKLVLHFNAPLQRFEEAE